MMILFFYIEVWGFEFNLSVKQWFIWLVSERDNEHLYSKRVISIESSYFKLRFAMEHEYALKSY